MCLDSRTAICILVMSGGDNCFLLFFPLSDIDLRDFDGRKIRSVGETAYLLLEPSRLYHVEYLKAVAVELSGL